MTRQPQILDSLDHFLFGAPLYSIYALPDDLEIVKRLYGRKPNDHVDGHCPFCRRASTFTIGPASCPNGDPWNNINVRNSLDDLRLRCVRNENSHRIWYWFVINKMSIEKIGQYPSLATISNDEVSQYRKSMADEDSQEFHKAIGLAAHGVGVGSFVYLRRVFERLVYRRFEEFKAQEGWTDDRFYGVRMTEKIQLLKGHLPSFLVENAKIYSILSIGVHELDEQACLGYFDVMKHSIVIILEEDKKKREELALRSKFSEAIAKFQPPQQDKEKS